MKTFGEGFRVCWFYGFMVFDKVCGNENLPRVTKEMLFGGQCIGLQSFESPGLVFFFPRFSV